MTLNEKRSLISLFLIILIFGTLITLRQVSELKAEILYELELIENVRQRLLQTRERLDNYPESDSQFNAASLQTFFVDRIDIYERASDLSNKLSARGLQAQLLTVHEGENEIEISVRDDTERILKFLEDIQNMETAVRFKNLIIQRQGNSELRCNLRMSYAEK